MRPYLKGRQVAGILLDNWLKGRRRAVWISKSDKLIRGCAARLVRAWRGAAPGYSRCPRFPAGYADPARGRLSFFATYATLRSDERGEKLFARWADRRMVWASGFDGVIVFDVVACDAERRWRQGRAR